MSTKNRTQGDVSPCKWLMIQYNLDSMCPDSTFYRLVRHFLLEHITYFVNKQSTWNWLVRLMALEPRGFTSRNVKNAGVQVFCYALVLWCSAAEIPFTCRLYCRLRWCRRLWGPTLARRWWRNSLRWDRAARRTPPEALWCSILWL